MEDMEKKFFRVEFEPSGKVVNVKPGSTIMEAANRAGIYINSICGGKGLCGKCVVIVLDGRVNMKSNTFLEKEQLEKGYVMACLTEVLSDLKVEIPEESRLEEKPKFKKEQAGTLDIHGRLKSSYPHNPLCRKESLELPTPSIMDNLSDLDRIKHELEQTGRFHAISVELKNIRSLPGILRDSDFKVTVTLSLKENAFEMSRFEAGDTSDINYGIAVDVGTTTIMANLINLNNRKICGTTSAYNSQMQYGEDVISRIVYTQENRDGLENLHHSVVKDINNLIQSLVNQSNIQHDNVNYMICTGNTIMIHILLGVTPENIRRDPYIPVFGKPPAVCAEEIGINISKTGYINFLPGAGAYVGSDITADILASEMAREKEISLLIDVGTNGEIVLGSIDWLICCSASAGPAFEGAGTRCGMRATSGAIEKVRILKNGNIHLGIIGGHKYKPKGICGSGYIDLVAELFKAGIVDRTGRFRTGNNNSSLREGEGEPEFLLVGKVDSASGKDIVITESDIATLIRTKGAIFTAAEAIMKHVGLTWSSIERIFISGGFGNYLDIKHSITIGLLPDIELEKFHFIGNGSITGAQMSLLSLDAFMMAKNIVRKMTYFDLSTDSWFMKEYTSSLFLPHTDLEKFPSVEVLKTQ